MRRGVLATLLAIFMVGGSASIAAAATPAPIISQPPQCFVVKNGALPTCDLASDGTWSVIYPKHAGNINPSETTDGSSGGSNTRRDLGIVALLVGVVGVGVIVWRQWGSSTR